MMPALRCLVASAVLPLLALPALAGDVVVFAAASLKTALDGIAAAHEAATGDDVVLSYAATSALARQIERGAPADIFISASRDWMDHLDAAGRIAPETRVDLLGNDLVLVQHGPGGEAMLLSSDFDFAGALGGGRLAMALVDAVPAGQYGRAALQSLGLWDAVAAQVAQTDNVRAALALVALGEARYGIVYASDARAEPRVSIAGRFPADSHPPIVYPAALIAGRETPAVQAFLTALTQEPARAVFRAQGFRPLPD